MGQPLVIDSDLAQAIRNYLGTCPHDQVCKLIQAMDQMPKANIVEPEKPERIEDV